MMMTQTCALPNRRIHRFAQLGAGTCVRTRSLRHVLLMLQSSGSPVTVGWQLPAYLPSGPPSQQHLWKALAVWQASLCQTPAENEQQSLQGCGGIAGVEGRFTEPPFWAVNVWDQVFFCPHSVLRNVVCPVPSV